MQDAEENKAGAAALCGIGGAADQRHLSSGAQRLLAGAALRNNLPSPPYDLVLDTDRSTNHCFSKSIHHSTWYS